MTDIVERLRFAAGASHRPPQMLREAADEIERLRADMKEANEAIHELQQAACDRDGVPMPSQRSVVAQQKIEIERLRAALREICGPITVMADAETVSACQDLHELICMQARAALGEAKDE